MSEEESRDTRECLESTPFAGKEKRDKRPRWILFADEHDPRRGSAGSGALRPNNERAQDEADTQNLKTRIERARARSRRLKRISRAPAVNKFFTVNGGHTRHFTGGRFIGIWPAKFRSIQRHTSLITGMNVRATEQSGAITQRRRVISTRHSTLSFLRSLRSNLLSTLSGFRLFLYVIYRRICKTGARCPIL